MSYFTLSSQEKHRFFCVHAFKRIRQHYFSKYWGTNAWAALHLKFWGDRPPSPPTIGLRPWLLPWMQINLISHSIRDNHKSISLLSHAASIPLTNALISTRIDCCNRFSLKETGLYNYSMPTL